MAQLRDGTILFKDATRVTLSSEGKDKLSPRLSLDGWVRSIQDSLIIVQEATGRECAYHPDFLERL